MRNALAVLPLAATTDSRVYFHVNPYILIPDIRLEIGLYPGPRGEAIGEVETAEWEGQRESNPIKPAALASYYGCK